jgi:DNA ligase (NAD+)
VHAFVEGGGEAARPRFETDGVVIKVDDRALQEKLGSTAKSPAGPSPSSIRRKKTTTVEDITVQVGRTAC